MRVAVTVLALALSLGCAASPAGPLAVELAPAPANPAQPRMGDRLSFHTVIRNLGSAPVRGVLAWLSLVRVDRGHERPMDLEDWSAHKAVTLARLAPGQSAAAQWPLRLIQSGRYRAVVSVVSRDVPGLTASPFAEFTVRPKPVVESRRVLPVTLGVPLLLGALLLVRRWRPGRWRARR